MGKFVVIKESAPAPYAGVTVEVKSVKVKHLRIISAAQSMSQEEKAKNGMQLFDIFEDILCNYTVRADGGPLLTKADAEEMDAEELSSLFKAVMDARNEHNQEAAAKN